MAGRPKIGSNAEIANKLSRQKRAKALLSDQAQASSFFSKGIISIPLLQCRAYHPNHDSR